MKKSVSHSKRRHSERRGPIRDRSAETKRGHRHSRRHHRSSRSSSSDTHKSRSTRPHNRHRSGSSRSRRHRRRSQQGSPKGKKGSRRRRSTQASSRSSSSSDSRSSSSTNSKRGGHKTASLKHPDGDTKLTAADLKDKMKKALDQAEKQDVALHEIKESKITRQTTVKDFQLASNPDDPLARANIIESIKSDSFLQSTFISTGSKTTSSLKMDASVHDDAMFGTGTKAAKVINASKFDISSIQLPSERPKTTVTVITDPQMLINNKYHVTKAEKAQVWMQYYDVMYDKLITTI